MKRFIVFIIAGFILNVSWFANAQEIKLDSLEQNPGDTVLMPLKFYGLMNVGALTLYIAYDTTVLEYLGITNVIPEANGILANPLPQDTNYVVGLSWVTPTVGVDFPDGKVLDIKFHYKGGTSQLLFTDFCEVVDWDVNPIEVTYFGGYVWEHVVGFENRFPARDLKIWNSGNGNLTYSPASPEENVSLIVYDLSGKICLERYYETAIEVTVSTGLKTGLYIVEVRSKDFNTTQKIFIN